MEIINFNSLESMTEYKNSIKDMSVEKLQAEEEKLTKKLKLNYIVVDDYYYSSKEINISDKPNEMVRIFNRKRISFVSAFLSGCFREYGIDYAIAWNFINKKFLESAYMPGYARSPLNGKQVSLADKLNYQGCVAYKNYIMFVYDNLSNKRYSFENAVYKALNDEVNLDQNFDRARFFTNKYLPKGINAVHKNILKLDVLKEIVKEKTAIPEKPTQDELK